MRSDPSLAARRSVDSGTDQLRLLFEVSEAVASHRDLTALFRDLARRLPAVVPFEVIALFLHDPEKNVMRVHMLGTADADRIPPGLEVPVDGSFSGTVFTTQQPVVVRSPRTRAASRHRVAGAADRRAVVLHAAADDDRAAARRDRIREPAPARVRRCGAGVPASRSPGRSRWPSTTCCTTRATSAAQLELSQERDRLRLLLEVSESIAVVPRPE